MLIIIFLKVTFPVHNEGKRECRYKTWYILSKESECSGSDGTE